MSASALGLTCISCHVGFGDVQMHREHYKSDWHRFNLMRKVAELPPVSIETFLLRAENHKQALENNKDSKNNQPATYCETCHTVFRTANAFSNHMNSKKHFEMEAKSKIRQIQVENKNLKNLIKNQEAAQTFTTSQAAATTSSESQSDLGNSRMKKMDLMNTAELEEVEDSLDEDLEGSDWESIDEDSEGELVNTLEELFDGTPLMENECLFCSTIHSDLAKCIDHMTIAHSFFIPDVEYLSDLSGLISYLGRKIGAGRMCIWCSMPGLKRFKTVSSLQQHMVDKGHCKMLHEGEALLEYAEFYDYTGSYPDQDGDAEVEVELPTLDSDDWQLVLPSGATIGHRSLHRYFKQNIKPVKEDCIVSGKHRASIQRLMHQYRALGHGDSSSKVIKQKAKDLFMVKQWQAKQQLKIGLKNFQPHYRPQILF